MSLRVEVSDRVASPWLDHPAGLVAWTIVIGTVIRVVLAGAAIDVGHSEAYYIASARHLALSYFDHPPLSFWITWATMRVSGSDALLVLRTPFILMFIATTWLVYRLGVELFGTRAGAVAALLLNISPLFAISTGAWVGPDGPLMCFLLASTLCVARIAFVPAQKRRMLLWAQAGLWLGLAMLSKYHAALLAVGFFLFASTSRGHRRWFVEPGPYLACIVTLAVFSPVLIWNAQNGWVSFIFQGVRLVVGQGLLPLSLLASISGQALLIGPWIWGPLIYVWAHALVEGPRDSRCWFLAVLAAVPILLLTLNALWEPVSGHFHWQAPGYLLLYPLAGKLAAERIEQHHVATKRWVLASTGTMVLIVVILGTHAATGWLQLLVPGSIARSFEDPVLRGVAWKPLRPALGAQGLLTRARLFVVTADLRDSGKVDLELGRSLPVVCLCPDPRNMAFVRDVRDFQGWDALIIVPDQPPLDVIARYGEYFRHIEPLDVIEVRRGDQVALTLRTYYATDYYRPYPLLLPAH